MLSEIDLALVWVLINVLEPGHLIPYLGHPRVFGDHLKRRLTGPPRSPHWHPRAAGQQSEPQGSRSNWTPPLGVGPPHPSPLLLVPLRYALPLHSVNPSPPHPLPPLGCPSRPPSSARPERNARGLTVDPDREATASASPPTGQLVIRR